MSDVSKTNELIVEAREALGRINIHAFPDDLAYQYRGGVLGRNVTEILRDVADALEAATRVPAQGEPNDDRERIAAILQLRHPGNMYSTCERDADAILAAGFSRATVPDAATEARIERWRQLVGKGVEERMAAEAERDAALAAVERLKVWLDENRPLRCILDYGGEGEAQDDYEAIMSFFAALDGAPEPEVKP